MLHIRWHLHISASSRWRLFLHILLMVLVTLEVFKLLLHQTSELLIMVIRSACQALFSLYKQICCVGVQVTLSRVRLQRERGGKLATFRVKFKITLFLKRLIYGTFEESSFSACSVPSPPPHFTSIHLLYTDLPLPTPTSPPPSDSVTNEAPRSGTIHSPSHGARAPAFN